MCSGRSTTTLKTPIGIPLAALNSRLTQDHAARITVGKENGDTIHAAAIGGTCIEPLPVTEYARGRRLSPAWGLSSTSRSDGTFGVPPRVAALVEQRWTPGRSSVGPGLGRPSAALWALAATRLRPGRLSAG